MGATLTINDTINFVQPYLGFYPLAVNSTPYPAVHIANTVAQVMLAPPFKWRWNRNTVSFTATSGTQDYTQSVSDFGFIEKAQVKDVNNNNTWKEIQNRLDLSLDSATSCPKNICAVLDDNAGNITFRLMPVPGAAYPVTVQYQKAQPLFTLLTNTWAPLPDFMFYVYSLGFMAFALLYKGDSRFPGAMQQFATTLIANSEGLTESEMNIFLQTWSGITNTVALTALKQAQGNQVRVIG